MSGKSELTRVNTNIAGCAHFFKKNELKRPSCRSLKVREGPVKLVAGGEGKWKNDF